MSKILEEELKERLHLKKLERLAASFSGACISNGFAFNTDDEKGIFVKTNASLNAEIMFSGELLSLKAIIATKCIKVPEGITVITNYDDKKTSAIVMQFLKMVPLSGESSRKLGSDLANLHDYNNKLMKFQDKAVRWIGNQQPSIKHLIADRKQTSIDSDEITYSKHSIRARNEHKEDVSLAGKSDRFLPQPGTEVITKFGFDVPTSCGSVPQVNEWTSDWVAFYARHRLDVTIRSLLSEHSDRELHESWSHLQLKIDKLFDDFKYKGSGEGEITPSLLHGDLWSGNAAQLSESSDCVVYDPASFYGHAEYDLAIARMFGGFSHEFETAYFDALPKAKNFEKRNKLYQLFHHLNHWNHFGSGYRSSSLNLMKSLLKSTS